MKKNPFYTVMVIPHTERRPKSLKIPVKLIRFMSLSLIISMVSSSVWLYDYTITKEQNQTLQVTKFKNELLIEEYSKDYLALYQDIKTLKEQMVAMQDLEDQIRQKNDFDPTKSFFSKQNQTALSGSSDKSKMVASTLPINETKETVDTLKEAIPEKEKSLFELIRLMENRNEYILSIPSLWPTVGRITSGFGYRRDPFNGLRSFHDGVDIANSYGTPIYATADGIVIYSGWNGGYGYEVAINHGSGFTTYYSHNSRNVVRKGDFVRKGQIVAYMGSTGRSTGPHVDYRIKKNGKYINPINYMN